jgi:hypothetical protein
MYFKVILWFSYLNLYLSNIFLFIFQLKFEVSLPMYYLSRDFKQSTWNMSNVTIDIGKVHNMHNYVMGSF